MLNVFSVKNFHKLKKNFQFKKDRDFIIRTLKSTFSRSSRSILATINIKISSIENLCNTSVQLYFSTE